MKIGAPERSRRLQGRVADLQQAYKQLPSSLYRKALDMLAVECLSWERKPYRARSPMFGQAAAVYSFMRFSRAVVELGMSLLSLVLVQFFDDFTQIEPAKSSASAPQAMEDLLALLGWNLSTSDESRNLSPASSRR